MIGREVAIDTNWAVAVMNADVMPTEAIRGFDVAVFPAPVAGELLFGARNSGRVAENLARVEKLIHSRRIIPVDLAVARTYSEIRLRLKKKGRPIPDTDVWIAACCLAHDLPLATLDDHFAFVDHLTLVPRF